MRLRGPGDFFGSRQHGLPKLKIADILTDTKILTQTQQLAMDIMENDPQFQKAGYSQIGRMVARKIQTLQAVNAANTI